MENTNKRWISRGELNTDRMYALSSKYNISNAFAAILDKRNINYEDIISPYLIAPDPHLLKDMDLGVGLVEEAIKGGKVIGIINDYDVDGITSGIIMRDGINACGGNSFIVTPSRIIDGYGASKRLIDEVKSKGAEVVITTDNGIAAFEAMEYAKSLGLTVIITDHHEVQLEDGVEKLPVADAIIDPKQRACTYPFKEICGAEVAYKFICLLTNRFYFDPEVKEKLIRIFTELAAIGTVCDVMPLVKENRGLVKEGLNLLRLSQIVGVRQLMKVKSIDPNKITAFNIGFGIGPCINAMSRIYDDTETPTALFTEKDHVKAEKVAKKLSAANELRKEIQDKAVSETLSSINDEEKIKFIYIKGSNPAIMGIVAGKIKEATGHPTICFTDDKEGIIKGSGRSTESFDMFAAMSKHSDLFEKFGGHPGAIGISIKKENFDKIKKLVNEDAADAEFFEEVVYDLSMAMGLVNLQLTKELASLEPFGNGNPAPVLLDEKSYLTKLSRMGKDNKYLRMTFVDRAGNSTNAVYFGDAGVFDSYISSNYGNDVLNKLYNPISPIFLAINTLYSPKINVWNGSESVSCTIEDYRIRKE